MLAIDVLKLLAINSNFTKDTRYSTPERGEQPIFYNGESLIVPSHATLLGIDSCVCVCNALHPLLVVIMLHFSVFQRKMRIHKLQGEFVSFFYLAFLWLIFSLSCRIISRAVLLASTSPFSSASTLIVRRLLLILWLLLIFSTLQLFSFFFISLCKFLRRCDWLDIVLLLISEVLVVGEILDLHCDAAETESRGQRANLHLTTASVFDTRVQKFVRLAGRANHH